LQELPELQARLPAIDVTIVRMLQATSKASLPTEPDIDVPFLFLKQKILQRRV
jgi:hypothetical protein